MPVRRPTSRAVAALCCAAGLSLGATACGSGDPVDRIGSGGAQPTLDTTPLEPTPAPGSTTSTAGPGTVVATPPATTATATTPATTTPPDSATTGGAEAGSDPSATGGVSAQDAGDATFTIDGDGQLGPSGVNAPAGVPVKVKLRNEDDQTHEVVVLIQNRPERTIAPGATATVDLIPLAPGSYTMLLDGGGSAAVLQVGPDQGP